MNIYEIKNLYFKYNKNDELIFNDFNVNIEEGKIYSLLGKNGVGKSTLFYMMLNIIKNYEGSIKLYDKNIKNINHSDVAKLVGFVPQIPKLSFDYTAREYVAMGLVSRTKLFENISKKDEELIDRAFEILEIEYLKNKYFFDMSGGEKQQVVIARSIVSEPKIIIFDEPTAHLDIHNQYKVLKIIEQLNQKCYTIIMSTHDPNQVTLLNDYVIMMDGVGSCISGKTSELINEENLYKLYNTKINITNIDDRKICFIKK